MHFRQALTLLRKIIEFCSVRTGERLEHANVEWLESVGGVRGEHDE